MDEHLEAYFHGEYVTVWVNPDDHEDWEFVDEEPEHWEDTHANRRAMVTAIGHTLDRLREP